MKKIGRKSFIRQLSTVSAASLVAASCGPGSNESSSTAPNIISNKKYRWYMVTTWPPNFPIIGTGINRFAELVNIMSQGQLEIRVYGGGELIPPLEVFDAVSSGTAQIGHGASYYWTGKVPAAQFFTTVPFGLNSQQQSAWIHHGGGIELWKKIYESYNLVPFVAGNTNIQMGGWFNKEINTVEDFQSLKMRIPGLAGKILKEVGATPVLVAGGEIYTNLERGVIDATEWLGPFHDQLMGFQRIAKYYYTPGWHEPGSSLELIVNKKDFDGLPDHLKAILEVCAGHLNDQMGSEFLWKNAQALEEMKNNSKLDIRTFDDSVLAALQNKTKETLENLSSEDDLIKEVFNSYSNFGKTIRPYSDISEKLYYTMLTS